MARDRHRQRIGTAGLRNRTHCRGRPDARGDLAVGCGSAGGNLPQRLPNALLEGSAPDVQGEVQADRRRFDQPDDAGDQRLEVRIATDHLGARKLVLQVLHQTFRIVARLLKLRNVVLVPAGCGERAGQAVFEAPVQANGAIIAGLAHRGDRDDARPGGAERAAAAATAAGTATRRIACDLIAIDEYLPDEQKNDVAFIKCDIEGADLFALRGAEQTIRRSRPTVVCEIDPWFLEGFDLRLSDVTSFFDALGYAVYRYEPAGAEGRRRLRPDPAGDTVTAGNRVFVHPDRRDRLEALLS